jgi:hypothetical protein
MNIEEVLRELLVELDELDGRAIWEACGCGAGDKACSECLRDEVRRKADDARLRLDKLRHGDAVA